MSEGRSPGRKTVSAYGDGGFRIAGERREGSVLVLPDRVAAWPVARMADLGPESLREAIAVADAIDVLLLGCGDEAATVPRSLRDALRAHGIVVDAMDTGAACRTYNVLLGEGRAVAAALIAV